MKRSVINYYGGKTAIAEELVSYFSPHRMYIEPFFGSGVVLLNKPRSPLEIVNDYDKRLYNFYTVLFLHEEEMMEEVFKLARGHQLFKNLYSNHLLEGEAITVDVGNITEENIKQAAMFYFVSYHTYNSMFQSEGRGVVYMSLKKPMRLDLFRPYFRNKSRTFIERLRLVYFYNEDFNDFFTRMMPKTRKEKSFMYLDPPYYLDYDPYALSFSHDQHEELWDWLCQFDSVGVKFLLSYNICEEIEDLYQDRFFLNTVTFHYGSRAGSKTQTKADHYGTEYLISNYDIYEEQEKNKRRKHNVHARPLEDFLKENKTNFEKSD